MVVHIIRQDSTPPFSSLLKAWVVAIIIFLVADVAWILLNVGKAYQKLVRAIQGGAPMRASKTAAVVAYVFLAAGMLMVIMSLPASLPPSLPSSRGICYQYYAKNVAWGAAWGAIIYGSYAYTNATIFSRDFKMLTTGVKEVVWGAFVFGISTLGGVVALQWMRRDKLTTPATTT